MESRITLLGTRSTCIAVGVLIAAFPAVDDIIGLSSRVLAFVPILFAGVLIGLYFTTDRSAHLQRSSFVGAGLGVLVMLVPVVLFVQSGPKPAVAAVIIGVPAVVGFAVFTLFMAYLLWSVPDPFAPRWVSVTLVVAPVVDPLVNAIITPVLSVGISVTGLSWIVIGVTLRPDNDLDDDSTTATTQTN